MFQHFPRVEYYISIADDYSQLEKIKEEVNELEFDIENNGSSREICSELKDIIQACMTKLYKMEDDGEIDLEYELEKHALKMGDRIELISFNGSLGIIGDGRDS